MTFGSHRSLRQNSYLSLLSLGFLGFSHLIHLKSLDVIGSKVRPFHPFFSGYQVGNRAKKSPKWLPNRITEGLLFRFRETVFRHSCAVDSFVNSFLYVISTANAPNGAVIKIARTATVNTTWPQERPMVRGIEPMAACTVAFGV